MGALKPADAAQVRDLVAWAAAEQKPLALAATGTRPLGYAVQAEHRVDLSALAGVVTYEPEELVLTARPGTSLAELDELLAQRQQMLAWEPVRPLGAGPGTLGGALASNLAGPRRFKIGAARDHFLGFTAVSGRGEAFKGGSKVVKNVTGYDLPKLLAGSWGTLAVLTEVTVKVLPAPEVSTTLALMGVDAAAAVQAMAACAASPHDPSGLAYAPQAPGFAASACLVRIEGAPRSVAWRRDALARLLQPFGQVEEGPSAPLWDEIRDGLWFAPLRDRAIWRLSVAPAEGPAVAAALGGPYVMDWAGGLIWVATPPELDVRAVLPPGGHAMLVRAPAGAAPAPWSTPTGPLAELQRRVKNAFDPHHILNPGRFP